MNNCITQSQQKINMTTLIKVEFIVGLLQQIYLGVAGSTCGIDLYNNTVCTHIDSALLWQNSKWRKYNLKVCVGFPSIIYAKHCELNYSVYVNI